MTTLKRGTPKQPKPAKRLHASAGDATADCQEQFNIQIALRATVPQSAKFIATPGLATMFNTWSTSTDNAQALYKEIIAAESVLEQKYTSLGTLMLQYKNDRDAFLVGAAGVCDNEDDIRAFGLKTKSGRRRIEVAVPGDLHVTFGDTIGELTVRWPRIEGAAAYIAELTSAEPDLETGWSQCYAGSGSSFRLTGLTMGQKIWLRVRSLAKKPSAWSKPIEVIVR